VVTIRGLMNYTTGHTWIHYNFLSY